MDVTFGKFQDDAADIIFDGKVVGWLERTKTERFASESSRARVSRVSHYEINLTDDDHDAALTAVMGTDVHHVDGKGEARKVLALALTRPKQD